MRIKLAVHKGILKGILGDVYRMKDVKKLMRRKFLYRQEDMYELKDTAPVAKENKNCISSARHSQIPGKLLPEPKTCSISLPEKSATPDHAHIT